MTAAAETGMANPSRFAREIRAALLYNVAGQIEAEAERADLALAGRTMAPTPVAYELIDALRLIAAAARGEAATP